MPSITVLDSTGATQTVQTLPAVGQAAKAASLPVALASDQGTLTVGGNSAVVGGSFSRPADTTAYGINDLVANSTTAASVVPMSFTVARVNGGTFSIPRARLQTTKTGLSGSENFRLYLFTSSPTVANGDNGALSVNGRASGFIGAFDITLSNVFNDGAKGMAGPLAGSQVIAAAAAGSQVIYGLLQALNAYTPANAETFTVELEVQQD